MLQTRYPKNQKLLFTVLLLCAICTRVVNAQINITDSVESYLTKQLTAWPQEKIYLQTDKAHYLSGERIWFRSHLVDALTHQPAFMSRYVYVELISPIENLTERIMIRPDSTGAYSGYFDLSDDLVEGTYTLRAYTNYMRNSGEEHFFKKSIEILDPFSLQIEPVLSFDVDKNNVVATITFNDRQTGEQAVPSIVSCKLVHKEEKVLKPDGDNRYRWSVKLPSKVENRTMLLSVLYNDRKYNRFYTIPYDENDFEVSLFPEGGYLVPGATCQVAYKAINPSGLGEDISGELYNSKDEEILTFKSVHNGMGFFNFNVLDGETYYVLTRNGSGITKRVALPEANSNALTISARSIGSRIIAAVLGTPQGEHGQLSLLVHHKGLAVYHETVSPDAAALTFPAESLPFGLINILLLDQHNNILSERMLFNQFGSNVAKLGFVSDEKYKRREKVNLTIKLADGADSPMAGNMAVSVTDKNGVMQDTTNSIVSELLLSSELRGHIESPMSYFNNGKVNKNALDALLMTQGWRRYDIPAVLKGRIEIPEKYAPELSQRITGKADGLFSSLKEGEISLMATLDSMLSTVVTEADNRGRFVFEVEYPAGTTILVQSLSKRGSKINLINLDIPTFPEVLGSRVPLRANTEERHNEDLDAYLQKADDEYTRLHGIRTIMLDEFTVTAQAVEKYKESVYYSPLAATGVKTAEDIEKMSVSSFRSLLYRQPGVVVRGDKVTTTRSDQPILFIIDNMRYDDFGERLDDIDVSSIESLFVIRDNSMMPGYFPGTEGAIVITTKIGFKAKPKKAPNIDKITPLGYQVAAEFYSPMYETEEERDSYVPDLRTTILWKPNLLFSEEGEAQVEFYAADVPTIYQVVVEGVSDSGLPVRSDYEIVIEGTAER